MFDVTPWTAAWFLPPLLPIAVWVVWSDLSTMKIPNKAVIATIAVFAVVGLIALPFGEYLPRYLHVVAILAVGFVLNMIGLMGAGDAKFMAAMAAFIDPQDAVPFLYLLAGVTIAALILHRSLKRVPAVRNRTPDWESWTRRDFPMGFALAPALIFYLVLGLVAA